MGNSSTPPSRSKPLTQAQYDNVVNEKNQCKSQYNNINKKYKSLNSQFQMVKQGCANSGDVKEKAKEMFNLLENRYLDRLTLIKTQQDMITNIVLNINT